MQASLALGSCKLVQQCDQIVSTYLGDEGPAVEVPLDGTIYDLESGKVLLAELFCSSQYNHVLGALQIDMRCFRICVHAVEQGLLLSLQVLEWCPKNNLVRKVLGAIKVAVGLSSCCLFCN